jgi:hypothetical protein
LGLHTGAAIPITFEKFYEHIPTRNIQRLAAMHFCVFPYFLDWADFVTSFFGKPSIFDSNTRLGWHHYYPYVCQAFCKGRNNDNRSFI